MKKATFELTETEIRKALKDMKSQYKTAKENFEYEGASMLLEDIRNLQQELERRRVG